MQRCQRLARTVGGNTLGRSSGSYGTPTASYGKDVPGTQIWVFKRWSLALPYKRGEPGAVVGVVLGVLWYSFKLDRVAFGKNLKIERFEGLKNFFKSVCSEILMM